MPESLPHIDEHRVSVAAPADAVWTAVLDTVDRSFSPSASAAYARAVGCSPARSSGPRPLAEGSTIPGFAVTGAAPPIELILEGSHRFSRYALIFRLAEPSAGNTTLRAETRAAFPGVLGAAYRTAVITTGGHAIGVRRLLNTIKRRAEHPSP